jgi:hypothetical protein
MILKMVTVNFVKADPVRLPKPYKEGEPRKWSIQLVTTDKAVRDYWKSLSLKITAVVPDDGDPYFKTNIYKNCTKREGGPADPVEVVDGNGTPIDPNRVGNGSICNVRIYQWENSTGNISTQLQAIQVVTWIVKEASQREEFDQVETKVVNPAAEPVTESTTPTAEAPY